MALHIVIATAEAHAADGLLDEDALWSSLPVTDRDDDFDLARAYLLQDHDVLNLFDPALDGIEAALSPGPTGCGSTGGDVLSEENYGDIDADVIVLFTDPTDTVDSVAAITGSPLWPADRRVLLISIGHAFSGPFSVGSYDDIIESELLG